MGVEHPTAGGYAKLATVITPDLGIVGQARPGETVRFEAVETDEALRIAAAAEAPFAPVAEGVR
jgi:allophanate hydrolase subunit 2